MIALIITIIILVILAAVSIRAAYNSGIVNYSVNRTQKYIEGAKDEEDLISSTQGMMESVINKINALGKSDVPDLLRKYVLGADGNGKDLYDILDYDWDDDGAFYNDPSSITDAHDTVIYLNELWGGSVDRSVIGDIYIKYNNVGYKIIVEEEYDSVNDEYMYTTTDVVKVYEPKGMEGETIYFKANDDDLSTRPWLVLYDNGNTLDVVSIDIDDSWTYTLGNEGEGDNLEGGIDSYNNAVERLNEKCKTLVTNENDGIVYTKGTGQNAERYIRSIGTGFDLTDTSTYYTASFLETIPEGADAGKYNGVNKAKIEGRNPLLEGDMNAEQDVVRMSYFGLLNAQVNDILDPDASVYCYLASRKVDFAGGDVIFRVRSCRDGASGSDSEVVIINGYSGRWCGNIDDTRVRPVVRVYAESFQD